jgi:hypothetical protein
VRRRIPDVASGGGDKDENPYWETCVNSKPPSVDQAFLQQQAIYLFNRDLPLA